MLIEIGKNTDRELLLIEIGKNTDRDLDLKRRYSRAPLAAGERRCSWAGVPALPYGTS